MTVDDQTIYRWDNTPHFPDFHTFLHHRHAGPDETAEPFSAVSLIDVFQFIAASLVQ